MMPPLAPASSAATVPGAPPIRVAVRVRPAQPGPEQVHDSVLVANGRVGSVLRLQDEAVGISSGFEFDAVLGPRCGQQEVFDTCGKPVLEAALQGRRGSLLVYGESGAGKTYSLFGADDGSRSAGVVPQLAKALFLRLTPPDADKLEIHARVMSDLLGLGGKVSVTASYYELIAGVEHQVFDLLDAGAALTGDRYRAPPLPVKSSGEGFEPKGLKSMLVETPQELSQLLERGAAARAAGRSEESKFGQLRASSRAHTFLTLQLERAPPVGRAADRVQRTFDFFDKDRSGIIRAAELQTALAALGMASDWEAAMQTDSNATNRTGGIALGEFSGLVFTLQERAFALGSGKMVFIDLAASESFESGGDANPSNAVLPCSALLDAG